MLPHFFVEQSAMDSQYFSDLADYRADDKADPVYYARLTVMKAQLSQMKSTPNQKPDSAQVRGR